MSTYGFVYVLRNVCMPGIYKIGMTDRAQSQRAEELSNGTAIPTPFEVVCFAEVNEAIKVEREMHARLDEFRVEPNREFFAFTGDDLNIIFAYFREEFTHVAYGDVSFLSDPRPGPVIHRAQSSVESSDLEMTNNAIKGPF